MYTSAAITGAQTVYGNLSWPQGQTNQRWQQHRCTQPSPPRHTAHQVDCACSSPLPKTKEPFSHSVITNLPIYTLLRPLGDVYHERNVFCCREEMLFGWYCCSWECGSLQDQGHCTKSIAPWVRLMSPQSCSPSSSQINASVTHYFQHAERNFSRGEKRIRCVWSKYRNNNEENNKDMETIHMAFKIKTLAWDLRLQLVTISDDAL